MSHSFLAIDFETANYSSESACSIGLVRVESNRIVAQMHELIRPPQKEFCFTRIHGITWKHVEASPTFEGIWLKLQPLFRGVDFIVAHNVGFDKRVLQACCKRYGIVLPEYQYQCTVQLARKHLNLYPTNLPAVCQALNIPLKHHDAISDALACAKIAMTVFQQNPFVLPEPVVQRKPRTQTRSRRLDLSN
jgi:DNA polymerase-3 subunit epsilon